VLIFAGSHSPGRRLFIPNRVATQREQLGYALYYLCWTLEHTLTLQGDASYYHEVSARTPAGGAKPQAYVRENSMTFKIFSEPESFRQWFVEGRPSGEFVPDKTVALVVTSGFFGATPKPTGETFAQMSVTAPAKSQLVVHLHASTIRLIYPSFAVRGINPVPIAPHTFSAKPWTSRSRNCISDLRAGGNSAGRVRRKP